MEQIAPAYIAARAAINRLGRPHEGSTQRGQGMVEYALILVLIAIVVIVVVSVVGKRVSNVFSNVSNGLAQ